MPDNWMRSNDKATFYTDTMKSSYMRGRRSIVPCANILGGGSSINFQMYTRASASDWGEYARATSPASPMADGMVVSHQTTSKWRAGPRETSSRS